MYWVGPLSGEYRSHLCRLGILGCFGLDLPKRNSGLVRNTRISVLPGVRGKLGQLQAMDFPADASRLDAFLETFAAA